MLSVQLTIKGFLNNKHTKLAQIFKQLYTNFNVNVEYTIYLQL